MAQCTGCPATATRSNLGRGQGRRRPDDLLHGGALGRRRRFADLEPDNQVGNGTAPAIGKMSVLKQWNLQDPPDAFEKRRNQVIFDTWQHNRNPFIDHPEWVTAIYGS